MRPTYVITIDGPAASGKTSVSRDLANKMGWKWISTGAFYRGLACIAFREKTNLDDPKAVADLARSDIWAVEMTDQQTNVVYRGINITDEIGREDNGQNASKISKYPEVRQALLPLQRACASSSYVLVAEGRDCGTVVFPDAVMKVYLDANSDSRAIRRSIEYTGEFDTKSYKEQKALQEQRDASDTQRAHAPLQIPEGADVIDTSAMGLNDVVDTIETLARATLKRQGLHRFLN